MVLRQSKKAFTIIRWFRGVNPFVIGSPEVEVGTSKEHEINLTLYYLVY